MNSTLTQGWLHAQYWRKEPRHLSKRAERHRAATPSLCQIDKYFANGPDIKFLNYQSISKHSNKNPPSENNFIKNIQLSLRTLPNGADIQSLTTPSPAMLEFEKPEHHGLYRFVLLIHTVPSVRALIINSPSRSTRCHIFALKRCAIVPISRDMSYDPYHRRGQRGPWLPSQGPDRTVLGEANLLGGLYRIPNGTKRYYSIRRLSCVSEPIEWQAVQSQALEVGERKK